MSHLILVLGMHRSGTSVITKSLECLGVSLGDNAEWYGKDNEAGFWEDRDVLAIDEALIARYGGIWSDPVCAVPPSPADWAVPDIKSIARRALTTKLERFPLLAIKEPRMCRLLPFWRDVLIRCEVSVIHVVRHPMAVARSLEKRNGIRIERGLALWLDHVERQFADVDPAWPSVTVRYEWFMEGAELEVRRIGDALGLTFDEDKAIEFGANHWRPDLQHEKPTLDPLPVEIEQAWLKALAKASP